MSTASETRMEAPFLGLRYFDEKDSHLFFGRDAQVSDVLEKLRRSRLVTVIGSSGSGKSSLVRAGLLPSLRAGFLLEAGPRWHVVKMRPGSSPIANLGRKLEETFSIEGLDVTLRRGPLGLIQAVEECRLAPVENVLIVADQFEELFRYQREAEDREKASEEAAAFVKLLLEATSQQRLPIFVVVTMRSDHLGDCAQFRDLPERINDGLYLIPRMRRDQLELAITGPVAVEDAAITPGLVQQLLNETGDDQDQLPVLQHALMRAWNQWNHAERPLDIADLGTIGGMKDSLSRHADEIYGALTTEQQRIARVLFQQLTERDAEGREIRRPASLGEIAAVAAVPTEAVEEVVRQFAAPEVAFVYHDGGDVDLTHESLIRKWTQLKGAGEDKGWIQEEVDARDQFREVLTRADRGDKLTGAALQAAVDWRALGLNAAWAKRYVKKGAPAGELERVVRFIDLCEKEVAAGRRRRIGAVVAGGIVLAVCTVIFIWLWLSAREQKKVALDALARSNSEEAARFAAVGRPDEALVYLASALHSSPESLTARSWTSDLILNQRWWLSRVVFQHKAGVRSAAFSLDGRRVVTASDDNTARVWEADTGKPVGAPLQHQGSVVSASFSPDGRRVVTASDDNTARIWEADTGKPIGAPLQHHRSVNSAAFSPDGRRIVTASDDGTAQVWEAETGKPAGAALQHQGRVVSAVFSPDGRRVVTASDDKTAQVWEAETGKPVGAPLQHQGSVVSASFSPDGRRVVTASMDETARVWEAETGKPDGAPLQHQYFVTSAAFSPDGRRVVTASEDNTARVWEVETGERDGTPLQHQHFVTSAAFSPDGRRVVTASFDNTARVWNAETGKPVGAPLQHQDSVNSAAFSPDGRRVVTASADKTARVWEADTGKLVGAPLQHQDSVNSAAFSPDGRRVVTASSDNTARVWDADTDKLVGSPLQHQGSVLSAAFSADGRRVVTASEDKTARVWEADTGKPVGSPLQHQGSVLSAAFSADGRRVVTASWDKTARVWDADTGKPVGSPLGHQDVLWSAAFSPNGRRVVTASQDKTARVWEAETGKPAGSPLQHQDAVLSAAFSPDGRRVLTTSGDHTARVWDVMLGFDSAAEVSWIADLAEWIGGYRLNELGSPVPLEEKERLELLHRLTGPSAPPKFDALRRRFLLNAR